jgi:hypothetical protein
MLSVRHWLVASTILLAPMGAAKPQSHTDSAGTVIPSVSPIYLYISAGASQMALAIGTNTALNVPNGATLAEFCVETAGVRYRDDGVAATSSSGVPVSAGSCFSYSGPLSTMSFTAQSGSPTLDVSYYKAK